MGVFAVVFLALFIAPVVVAQNQFSQDVLALNPLGFWPLTGNAHDGSGHAHHGIASNSDGISYIGSVAPLGMAAGPSAVFSSAQEGFITVGGSPSVLSFGSLQPFTAMAWIRTMNQGSDLMVIMGKYDLNAGAGWGMLVDNGDFGAPKGGGRLALIFGAGGEPVLLVESTIPVNDGNWHLVSVAYDGGGKASGVRMYLDGLNMPTTILNDSLGSSSILNSAPMTIGGAVDGDDAFEGCLNYVALFGTSLTPEQNLQLAQDAPGFRRILGQFAFGDGWYSAVYFANNGTSAVTFPVSFTGDLGHPLNVPSINDSSKTITLQPGGMVVIEAPNMGGLMQGYVSAILPTGVTGYGVFRQSVPGASDQEAVVPLSTATAQHQVLLYDETNGLVTAVAIVNPSQVPTTVAITITDLSGRDIGTSSVNLPPRGKTAVTLRSLPGLAGVVGSKGTAQFTVTSPTDGTGAVAVLGLRFNGLAFTSIPATGVSGRGMAVCAQFVVNS
jgi:hypothetical protein